jgi:hypothetical protein
VFLGSPIHCADKGQLLRRTARRVHTPRFLRPIMAGCRPSKHASTVRWRVLALTIARWSSQTRSRSIREHPRRSEAVPPQLPLRACTAGGYPEQSPRSRAG